MAPPCLGRVVPDAVRALGRDGLLLLLLLLRVPTFFALGFNRILTLGDPLASASSPASLSTSSASFASQSSSSELSSPIRVAADSRFLLPSILIFAMVAGDRSYVSLDLLTFTSCTSPISSDHRLWVWDSCNAELGVSSLPVRFRWRTFRHWTKTSWSILSNSVSSSMSAISLAMRWVARTASL